MLRVYSTDPVKQILSLKDKSCPADIELVKCVCGVEKVVECFEMRERGSLMLIVQGSSEILSGSSC